MACLPSAQVPASAVAHSKHNTIPMFVQQTLYHEAKPLLAGRGFHVRGLYSKHSTIRDVCTVNYILMARMRIPRSDETPAIPRAAGIDARERSMSEHLTTAATVADSACRQNGSASRSGVPPSRQRAAVRHGGSTFADGGEGAAGHDPRLRAAPSVFASPRLRAAASAFASPRLRPAASVFASPRLRATASVHLRPVIFLTKYS